MDVWFPQNEAVTDGIRVKVDVMFVPERSVPHTNAYFFAYRVTLENEGSEPAKLLQRHWMITDAAGRVQRVDGPGVVGEQPELKPGDRYQYSSFCPLPTPYGTMEGSYDMQRRDGSKFAVAIPHFALSLPGAVN